MFSKISISAIGKTTKEFHEMENHYLKQIKTKISINISNSLSHLDKNQQIIKESEMLNQTPNTSEFLISLDKTGTQISSEELAANLAKWSLNYKSIKFIIGGSYGLSEELKKSSRFLLSFSKLTFPHQMARIMLLEQIYRSETILQGTQYHK